MRTEGLELRALVPVSMRTEAEHGQLGNRIAAMRGPLPVYIDDPVARLRAVSAAMEGLKESKQAVGAEVLAGVQNFAPPTILGAGLAAELLDAPVQPHRHQRAGAAVPALRARARDADVFPIAFLPREHALAIAIMSYNGWLNFGLLGDYDALPDLDAIADAHRGLARRARRARPGAEAPPRHSGHRSSPSPPPPKGSDLASAHSTRRRLSEC